MPRHNSIPQTGLAFLFVRQIRRHFLGGRRHPDDRRNILGPRPALAFVGSAELDAIDRQTGAEIKKAGAFRSVKFVRAKAGGIDSESRLVGNLPNDCTMSLCSKTPRFRQRAAISAIG